MKNMIKIQMSVKLRHESRKLSHCLWNSKVVWFPVIKLDGNWCWCDDILDIAPILSYSKRYLSIKHLWI